jgi:hypothetical protein
VKDFLQNILHRISSTMEQILFTLRKSTMKQPTIISLLFFITMSINTSVFAQAKPDTGYSTKSATNEQPAVNGAATNTLSGSPANDTMTNASRSDVSGAGNTASAAEPGGEHAVGGSSDYTNSPNDQHNSGNWGLLGLLGLFGLLGYLRPPGMTTFIRHRRLGRI